jgi:transcriptional regulator with XRE-family HTH domain
MDAILIGEKIKFYREKKGITQTELSDALKLAGKDTISKYERGLRFPSIDMLNKICDALDIDYKIIFTPKPKPKK